MSEFRRAGVRIISNYVRLLLSILFGLILVRWLWRTVGPEAYGLIALLTATAGFAVILEEIVGWSMIRELGAAHHSRAPGRFAMMYNSAVAVCIVTSLLTLLVFAVMLAILPFLRIPDELMVAARWFVIAKGVETAIIVLTAPAFNMYLVLERMVAHNGWLIAKRASHVVAAGSLFFLQPADAAGGLFLYGWMSAGLHGVVVLAAAFAMVVADSRLWPSVRQSRREGVRTILGMSGWNVAILGSQVLGLPAGQFMMNLWLGLFGNTIFALSSQLAGYARMVASGMTGGLDAVTARLSAHASGNETVRTLVRYSTMLHGLVAFPAVVLIVMLAEPFLRLWIGRDLARDAPEIPFAATLTVWLAPAFAAMCFGDNWMRILYGAGQIRRYAPLVVVGGFIHVVAALALLNLLPQATQHLGVAIAFTSMYLVVHLGMVPRVVSRAFQMPYIKVIDPLLRPLLASAVAAPILWLFRSYVPDWNVWWLALAAASYGAAYGLLAWFVVLPSHDRSRLTTALRVRLIQNPTA